MKPGNKVMHPKLGKGVVKQIKQFRGQAGVQVNFGYLEKFIPFDELGITSSIARPAELKGEPTQNPPRGMVSLPADVVEARMGILALRLGQILETHVEKLSVGTEQAEKDLKEAIRRAKREEPTLVLVEGTWGSGKTHLLTLLTAFSVQERFATVTVLLDGFSASLSDPMQLMEFITGAIRFPGEKVAGGVGNHLAHVSREWGLETLRMRGARRLADALSQVPDLAFDEPEVRHILEDYLGLTLSASAATAKIRNLGFRRSPLPSLRARSVKERAERFCELLQNWAQFCVAAGARGLLVVFDELDVEYASTAGWSKTRPARRRMLLNGFGELRKSKAPLLLAFGSAPAGPGVKPEDDAAKDIEVQIGGLDLRVEVPRPSEMQLKELGRRVLKLYIDAYPDFFIGSPETDLDKILDILIDNYRKDLNPVPRHFVRGALELLDVLPNLAPHLDSNVN